MEHEQVRRLLPAWQAGELDASTAAAVDEHVADCEGCQQHLEDDGPVDLPPTTLPASWTSESMRRGVRRTLWRTAFDTASLLLVVVIVGWFASMLLVQPVVSRGDRSEQALQATVDLPVMLTPGAQLTEWRLQSGWADRDMWAEVGLPVGAQLTETGRFSLSLDLLSVDISPLSYSNRLQWSDVVWRPDELPPAARGTVMLAWENGVDAARVDELARAEGVSLVWAGFDLSPAVDPDADPRGSSWALPAYDAPPLRPAVLGYSTCRGPTLPKGAGGVRFGGSAGGGSISMGLRSGGTSHALEQLRTAVANLASNADLTAAMADSGHAALTQITDTADWIAENEPDVRVAVLTGRVDALAPVVENADPDQATQLDTSLYNGDQGVCS